MEDLGPRDHILRKIEKAIDFSFIYDLVKDRYSEDTGTGVSGIDSLAKPFDDDSGKAAGLDKPKGEHERCFTYTAHTACDRHNFTLGVELSPANVHDRVMFKSIYNKVKTAFPDTKYVVADAGYKIPYSTTNRDDCRECKSNSEFCTHCSKKEQCTQSKSCQKTVIRHVWADYLDIAQDFRYTPRGKAIYWKREETIERVFTDAKEKHRLRYTTLRGNAKVTMLLCGNKISHFSSSIRVASLFVRSSCVKRSSQFWDSGR